MSNKLVEEFIDYIESIYESSLTHVLPITQDEKLKKLRHVLERLQDATVRQLSQQVMEIDVDCSGWTDEMLAEKMLRHAYFRSRPDNILPAHCMMIEAGKRLKRTFSPAKQWLIDQGPIKKHEPAPTGTLPPKNT